LATLLLLAGLLLSALLLLAGLRLSALLATLLLATLLLLAGLLAGILIHLYILSNVGSKRPQSDRAPGAKDNARAGALFPRGPCTNGKSKLELAHHPECSSLQQVEEFDDGTILAAVVARSTNSDSRADLDLRRLALADARG
jgi:hypothetical protein